MNNELQKETAIQNERQSIQKGKIANEIIKVLADNNLSIAQGMEVLNIASKKLGQQMVRIPSLKTSMNNYCPCPHQNNNTYTTSYITH